MIVKHLDINEKKEKLSWWAETSCIFIIYCQCISFSLKCASWLVIFI